MLLRDHPFHQGTSAWRSLTISTHDAAHQIGRFHHTARRQMRVTHRRSGTLMSKQPLNFVKGAPVVDQKTCKRMTQIVDLQIRQARLRPQIDPCRMNVIQRLF